MVPRSDRGRTTLAAVAVLCLVVLMSRVPFISAGYGADPDAWRVAVAAKTISESGRYTASRLPGYPVQELTYSLLWGRGPLVFNGVTALFSALSVGLFAFVMRRLRIGPYLYGAMALAFVPVVYVSSTASIDYLWALAFILGSLYAVLDDRPIIAGVCLGIAAGCRMSSILMLIPLCILMAGERGTRRAAGRMVVFSFVASVSAFCVYLPVLRRYGFEMFEFYQAGTPTSAVGLFSLGRAIRRAPGALFGASVETWGLLGCCAVAAALGVLVFGRLRRGARPGSGRALPRFGDPGAAFLTAVGVYLVLFIMLPAEAGYLIPAIPFVILVLAGSLRERVFKILCAALVLSPFVLGVKRQAAVLAPGGSARRLESGFVGRALVLEPLKGPIFVDHSIRARRAAFVDGVFCAADSLRHRSLIAAGRWYQELEADPRSENEGTVEYMGKLDLEELVRRKEDGYALYYLPGELEGYIARRGVDLRGYGAVPLVPHEGA